MAFCGRSSETGVGNGKEQREFSIDATWLYRVCGIEDAQSEHGTVCTTEQVCTFIR